MRSELDWTDREIASVADMIMGRRDALTRMKYGDPGFKLANFNLQRLEQELDGLLLRRNDLIGLEEAKEITEAPADLVDRS